MHPRTNPLENRKATPALTTGDLSTLTRLGDETFLAARFPNHYCWYILGGMLDLILTWVVLHLGGREINILAHRAIEFLDIWGLIALKIASIIVVITICETLARINKETVAKRLALAAIVVGFFPVAVALAQLATYGH